jgi:transcriptional regulator with XRE-family HTH domain
MKANRKPTPKTKAEKVEWWVDFGRRFRTTRLALGITEEEAAEAYGISLRGYRRLERGVDQRGRQYKLVCLAEKYNVSYDWLIAGRARSPGRWPPDIIAKARGRPCLPRALLVNQVLTLA